MKDRKAETPNDSCNHKKDEDFCLKCGVIFSKNNVF
jgi:hypothetical protein